MNGWTDTGWARSNSSADRISSLNYAELSSRWFHQTVVLLLPALIHWKWVVCLMYSECREPCPSNILVVQINARANSQRWWDPQLRKVRKCACTKKVNTEPVFVGIIQAFPFHYWCSKIVRLSGGTKNCCALGPEIRGRLQLTLTMLRIRLCRSWGI